MAGWTGLEPATFQGAFPLERMDSLHLVALWWLFSSLKRRLEKPRCIPRGMDRSMVFKGFQLQPLRAIWAFNGDVKSLAFLLKIIVKTLKEVLNIHGIGIIDKPS